MQLKTFDEGKARLVLRTHEARLAGAAYMAPAGDLSYED